MFKPNYASKNNIVTKGEMLDVLAQMSSAWFERETSYLGKHTSRGMGWGGIPAEAYILHPEA